MERRVSVVVMTYNRPQSLARCLDGLAAQALPAELFEVVVVDSSDPPATDVVAARSALLTLQHVTGRNLGVAGNRNRGARAARHPLIAFLDDDCVAASDWLDRLSSVLAARPCCLVGGRVLNAHPDRSVAVSGQVITDVVHAFFNPPGEEPRFLPGLNFAVDRERYLAIGGCDEAFGSLAAEDRDFVDRWRGAGGGLLWCPEAVVYHEHRCNLTGFVRQYFNYGRGAWRYHGLRRRRRSGSMGEDVALHLRLHRYLRPLIGELSPARGVQVLLLLCLWQAANAAGFAWQAALESFRHGAPSGSGAPV